MGPKPHINCDMGEGGHNEALLMPFVQAVNIACGGHTGDDKSMVKTLSLAMDHHLELGAHPSYPDRSNFGRKSIPMALSKLEYSLRSQIDDLITIAEKGGGTISYCKPHGALYHDMGKSQEVASLIIALMQDYRLALMLPFNSPVAQWSAGAGIAFIREAFIDRRYQHDATLMPRNTDDAVLVAPSEASNQLKSMFYQHELKLKDGSSIRIQADTYCIHGDNPSALSILKTIRSELDQA